MDLLPESVTTPNKVRFIRIFEQEFDETKDIIIDVDSLDSPISSGSEDSGPTISMAMKIDSQARDVKADSSTSQADDGTHVDADISAEKQRAESTPLSNDR